MDRRLQELLRKTQSGDPSAARHFVREFLRTDDFSGLSAYSQWIPLETVWPYVARGQLDCDLSDFYDYVYFNQIQDLHLGGEKVFGYGGQRVLLLRLQDDIFYPVHPTSDLHERNDAPCAFYSPFSYHFSWGEEVNWENPVLEAFMNRSIDLVTALLVPKGDPASFDYTLIDNYIIMSAKILGQPVLGQLSLSYSSSIPSLVEAFRVGAHSQPDQTGLISAIPVEHGYQLLYDIFDSRPGATRLIAQALLHETFNTSGALKDLPLREVGLFYRENYLDMNHGKYRDILRTHHRHDFTHWVRAQILQKIM